MKMNVFKRKSYDSGVWMQSQSNQSKIISSERLVFNERTDAKVLIVVISIHIL